MNGTKEFPVLPFYSLKGLPLEKSELENHVSLVVILSCDSLAQQMELVTKLYADFKETHKANYFFLDTCGMTSLNLPDTLKQNIYTLHCNDSLQSCISLLKEWPSGKPFALLDKNGIMRAYYAADNHEEKKTLEEHMAILLPRDYSEKVQLKREVGKK